MIAYYVILVEAATFHNIADLIHSHFLRGYKRHSILQIQIRLSIELKTLICLLNDGSINEIYLRGCSLQAGCKLFEVHVQIRLQESLRGVLDNSKAVVFDGRGSFRGVIECSQTRWSNHGITIVQADQCIRDNCTLLGIGGVKR